MKTKHSAVTKSTVTHRHPAMAHRIDTRLPRLAAEAIDRDEAPAPTPVMPDDAPVIAAMTHTPVRMVPLLMLLTAFLAGLALGKSL